MEQEEYNRIKKQRKREILEEQFKRIDCNLEEQDYNQQSHFKSREERDQYVLNKLCRQMEYYLSDANLRTDKFFRELVEKDNYVPLQTFLKCNKIKKLLNQQYKDSGNKQQLSILVLALKQSRLLKTKKDETAVKRKIKFTQENIGDLESRTIYVERIPKQVDNELLHQIFRKVGQITEAKISRFKESKVSKGFGFITFADVKSADDAIERYNNTVPKEFTEHGMSLKQWSKSYVEKIVE